MKVSVIVPTYRERENIEQLSERLAGAMRGYGDEWEIVVVDDDSRDGTEELCALLRDRFPIRLIVRTEDRGLSPAVLEGIADSRAEFVVVMDADLSHPPEAIPEMLAKIREGSADFVLGSRYVEGGQTESGWSLFRRLNSRVATLLVLPLVSIRDPMSGFFALRREDVDPGSLNPIGYKIGLEILVKGRFEKPAEHPIFFSDRVRGESKLNFTQQVHFLRHLRRLYHYRWPKPMEILQFLAVGAVGLAWDLIFYFLLQLAGASHVLARALSFWPAVTSNWFLNRIMTFKERPRESVGVQWLKFAAVSGVGFAISWGTYAFLTGRLGFFDEYRVLALLAGVALATVFNFTLSDLLVYSRGRRAEAQDRP